MKQRKQPAHTSKVFIGLFVVIALALTVFAFIVQAEQKKEADLDRADREKFTQLETRMNILLGEFKKVAPEGEWKLDKSCGRTGGKFENVGDEKFCNLSVGSDREIAISTQDAIHLVESNGFKRVAEGKSYEGKYISGRYVENAVFKYLYSEFSLSSNVRCILKSFNENKAFLFSPSFNCSSESLKYYYKYVQ